MASINRPDKVTMDAYNAERLSTSVVRVGQGPANSLPGMYSSFTGKLSTPILGAKSIQLLSGNFINSALQLNDNSQLMFFYYAGTVNDSTLTSTAANLKVIRLYPSWFVPQPAFTAFVRNRYFNSVAELVATLNQASSVGGDNITWNPKWVAGQVTFSFSESTRKITITGNGTTFIAPAAIDDPNVIAFTNLAGAIQSSSAETILMPGASTTGSSIRNGGNVMAQIVSTRTSMNSRLGFTYGYNTPPMFLSATVIKGCATNTGMPTTSGIEADAYPILLGAQNVNVYLNVANGGGLDSLNRKNLIGNIPIEVAPLCINSYTFSSVETPSLSTPNEIYEMTVEMRDEFGDPFTQPLNYNTRFVFGIKY